MRFFFLFIIIICISLTSFGQLSKKTWLVGGAGSFYSSTDYFTSRVESSTSKYTNIDISASIGYFMTTKLAGGLRPFFSSYKGSSSVGSSTNLYRVGVGPFLRYYFLKNDKQFNLVTDVSYQFGVNQFLGALHENGKYSTFSILAGPEIFFNASVGLEFLLGYSQKIISIRNSPGEFTLTKNGFQASIGFQFHLQKL